ncbi:hypothetical protein AB7813_08330 [Tardiphaga sp. 20_F10_N6_6]|uniref:hypothetical protein n=1 Tax=Tardiphaga sp. 20_F10_N6_6 TaxID=3240788 RepID=UPI003F88DC45
MELKDVLANAVNPALALLPDAMNSAKARVMLLAIGLQESAFRERVQVGGPAHGFWQFEKAGGVRGVMNYRTTNGIASDICALHHVPFNEDAVYAAIVNEDVLAAAFARLNLWTDPKPLPKIGDAQAAWDLYLRVWRPGKPHPAAWAKLYDQAAFAVMRDVQEAA